jgi:hypothetical protein
MDEFCKLSHRSKATLGKDHYHNLVDIVIIVGHSG